MRFFAPRTVFVALMGVVVTLADANGAELRLPGLDSSLNVSVSWGHAAAARSAHFLMLDSRDTLMLDTTPFQFEPGDDRRGPAWETYAGNGDVDGVHFRLAYRDQPVKVLQEPHVIWASLLEHSDEDTARRLRADPGFRADERTLTFQLNRQGTRGFTLTVDQLLREKAFWIPAFDMYVVSGKEFPRFKSHLATLAPFAGASIADVVARQEEASYASFTSRWEDMGSPAYKNPAQVGPGHIVCLAWDSSLHKFGIDRGAGVWNDYGNQDRFRFGYAFGDLAKDLTKTWKSQRLTRGLPVVTTVFEDDGIRYEVEQFAYPLNGPPAERRGDIPMALLQKLTVTELRGQARSLRIEMTHERELGAEITGAAIEGGLVLQETGSGRTLLLARGNEVVFAAEVRPGPKLKTAVLTASLTLGAGEGRELHFVLPSPPVAPEDRPKLLALQHASARAATLEFWERYLAQGARFEVPEETVNDLVRANLWHALRLPRRHGGQEAGVAIDLPYSNFAYDQTGTPWPVNQSVYVDTYIYDMRGYHAIAGEELDVMFRNNQEPDGRVKGFANWGVYTPGMLFSVAMHYLLSRDRAALERLLPAALKSLDWCLGEMRRASERPGPLGGLILAPLNDLSHEPRGWAFNQAYFSAGVKLLGRALAEIGHARAEECTTAARAFDAELERVFGRAATYAPLVQLRDHTWSPYVPGDALTPRRLFEVWYPTDVDTGPAHLPRLGALEPNGFLATCMLRDHEDNLFLGGLGMANEPVYNQHALAYLQRDDVKLAIRAFYSMLACAFSHSALEPVEHRYAWGQYFGPPSTDGAWFELLRRMLIDEAPDDALVLMRAAPRRWMEDGRRIVVERAPTFYGTLSMTAESRAAAGTITATIDMPKGKLPARLLVRFRHPQARPLRGATVNGAPWTDFDAAKEWVSIAAPRAMRYEIIATYD